MVFCGTVHVFYDEKFLTLYSARKSSILRETLYSAKSHCFLQRKHCVQPGAIAVRVHTHCHLQRNYVLLQGGGGGGGLKIVEKLFSAGRHCILQ